MHYSVANTLPFTSTPSPPSISRHMKSSVILIAMGAYPAW